MGCTGRMNFSSRNVLFTVFVGHPGTWGSQWWIWSAAWAMLWETGHLGDRETRHLQCGTGGSESERSRGAAWDASPWARATCDTPGPDPRPTGHCKSQGDQEQRAGPQTHCHRLSRPFSPFPWSGPGFLPCKFDSHIFWPIQLLVTVCPVSSLHSKVITLEVTILSLQCVMHGPPRRGGTQEGPAPGVGDP